MTKSQSFVQKVYLFNNLYFDKTHMGLDIFRFAVSFLLYSVSLRDALATVAVRPFLSVCVDGYGRIIVLVVVAGGRGSSTK